MKFIVHLKTKEGYIEKRYLDSSANVLAEMRGQTMARKEGKEYIKTVYDDLYLSIIKSINNLNGQAIIDDFKKWAINENTIFYEIKRIAKFNRIHVKQEEEIITLNLANYTINILGEYNEHGVLKIKSINVFEDDNMLLEEVLI